MNTRLRLSISILALLVIANVGWRVWANWGLITVEADDAPLAEVIQSIERQGGIRLVTNAAPDAKVTMHVRNVPLLRALRVLSVATDASWSVGYLAAPDKASIQTALAAISSGGETAGWKAFAFSMPGMPGMGGAGSSDPREERWEVAAAADGKLQTYFDQGSQSVNAQFWAPEGWNPQITAVPASGKVGEVVDRLAKASRGESAEFFLLLKRPQSAQGSVADSSHAQRHGGGGGFRGGPPGGVPDEATRAILEKRRLAQIETLPPAKKAAALAELEERKKFLDEIAQLSPEERERKMHERFEKGGERMETRMTQMGAMRTAEERAEFFRGVVQRKAEQSSR